MNENNFSSQNNSVPFNPGKSYSIPSMILGIVGLVFIWLPPLSFVVAVVGLLLGMVGKKKARAVGVPPSAMATAGIVCATIALVIWGIAIIIVAMGFVFYRTMG